MFSMYAQGTLVSRHLWALMVVLATVADAHADSLDGWWVSDGYGILLEIHGDEIKASEITAVSCLPSWTAKQRKKTLEDAEAVFVTSPANGEILVQPGTSADHKFVQYDWAASRVGFRRIAKPPAVCDKPTPNTPLSNFDIFWTTFDEHYPFFALHGVDWRELRDKYRPRITDQTSPNELFNIFKAMVEPLQDAHISIQGAGQRFNGRRKGTERLTDGTAQKIKETIEKNYVHDKLKSWCGGQVDYGQLPGSIGYLRITAFQQDVKALDEALDKVFENADKLRGLIIDVRINRGGSDVKGVAVASRLAAKEYLAFAKRTRNDPHDPNRFTAREETMVRPSSRPHFHGKVVLLTGDNTVSAGETFTMALMGRTPPVVRLGENTQGVFSDVLARRLPNGFQFGLPNEIFLTQDGKSFDGPGIPPQVSVAVFPKEELDQGRDRALEKAKEMVQGK